MPDISDLDAAIMDTLRADPTLAGLMPDGVWWDFAAPAAADRFVSVSRPDDSDLTLAFNTDAFERFTYQVKAVCQQTNGTAAKDAAKRIHELLHHGALELTAIGYSLMIMFRVRPIRYTQPDPVNATAKWEHRGGHYQVMVSY